METFERVSVQKAHEMMHPGPATIIDVRDPDAYAREHIPNAVVVNDENLEAFLQETDKEALLICYCYHGISSQRAALYFAQQGFRHVYSIDGGWEEWKTTYG